MLLLAPHAAQLRLVPRHLDVASDFEEIDRWDSDKDWEFQEEYVAEAKAVVKKATEGLIASLEKRVQAHTTHS